METAEIMKQITPEIERAIKENPVVEIKVNVNQYSKITDVSVTRRKRFSSVKNCPYHQG